MQVQKLKGGLNSIPKTLANGSVRPELVEYVQNLHLERLHHPHPSMSILIIIPSILDHPATRYRGHSSVIFVFYHKLPSSSRLRTYSYSSNKNSESKCTELWPSRPSGDSRREFGILSERWKSLHLTLNRKTQMALWNPTISTSDMSVAPNTPTCWSPAECMNEQSRKLQSRDLQEMQEQKRHFECSGLNIVILWFGMTSFHSMVKTRKLTMSTAYTGSWNWARIGNI